MEVIVSDEAKAKAYAGARGGVVYVRSHAHRCCSGPLVLLDTTTDAPRDAAEFVDVRAGADELSVRYRGNPEAGPHVLTIELRGRLRHRLVSFWDGCAFKP